MNSNRTAIRSRYIRKELSDKIYLGVFGVIFLVLGGFGLGSLLAGLLGCAFLVWYVLPVFKGYSKSFSSDLEKYGVSSEQVEADLAAGKAFGSISVGKRFVVVFDPVLKLIALRDLIWCYGVNTAVRYRAYGIIPVGSGKNFSVMLVSRDQVRTSAKAKREETQTILSLIKSNAPGVIIGYSQDVENLMKSHFDEAVRHVDKHNAGIL